MTSLTRTAILEESPTVRSTFVQLLGPVRRRCQARAALQALAVGMMAGSAACVALMLARPPFGGVPQALAALVAGPAIASLVGLARRPSCQDAASLVDDHYQWQDSTTSALEFSGDPSPSPLVSLQVAGALRRLSSARAGEVVPLRAPRTWPLAAVSLALALAAMAWPFVARDARADSPEPKPFQAALEEARQLEDHARQIEAAARELDDPSLHAMVAQIRRTIAELKQPGLDMRQTMAKISSLEASIAAQQQALKVPLVEGQLKALGASLAEAKPLEPAGQMLQEAKFGQAADELEKAGDSTIAEGEAKAVGQLLDKSAKEMQSQGLEKLGQATKKLAEGVKRGGGQPLKSGTKDMAKEIRDHERRKRINKLMAQEQQRLKECKDRCETRNLIAAQKKDEPEPGDAAAKPRPTSSKTEDAEKAALGTREELRGVAGEGPSETASEVVSADGPRASKRPSRKVHQKYERLSEAALEQEPIPLGHRRSIRRYFELIRPDSGANNAKPEP